MDKFKFISKDRVSKLPKEAGVYAFREGVKKRAKLLYIGKAANIKERVKNHFDQSNFKDNFFIDKVDKVGYLKTDSEIEALLLEARLIKKYQPKYNIVWRDDKNYFYAGITREKFPTVFITHQPNRVSSSVYYLSRIRRKKILNTKYKIQNTEYVGPFVNGRELKQTLSVLRRIFPYRTCKPYSGKPCLWYQLGRCPGPCQLGSKLAEQIPGLEDAIIKESQRNIRNFKKVLAGKKLLVLEDLKKQMAQSSKKQEFEKAAKIRDQINSFQKVLSHAKVFSEIHDQKIPWTKTEEKLKKILNIKGRVSRIEAYDISNIQGKEASGSLVVFINGRADKKYYRKFKIKIAGQPNDTAMIKEIIKRRFNHPEWGWPDLILIDGGKAQLNAAISIVKYKRQKTKDKIQVMALAKRENELFFEGRKQPLLLKILPREISDLILQLRDEAHRFAVSYHRKLRYLDLFKNT